VWLWRRLPHPDSLVSGGPEIDFGIQTDRTYILGEAKWLSPVRGQQGVGRDRDQLQLRRDFCEKYGRKLLTDCKTFVVLGVSPLGGLMAPTTKEIDGVQLRAADLTWEALCGLPEHPQHEELRAYLSWKGAYGS
jgi:hypothetical protein